jgi:cell division septum initiation protein DivIVA
MDLAAQLKQLEEMVREAKSMPLSSSVLVSREEVLGLIVEMQENLPEEIKQARWIVKDREELLAKARAEGERIVERAREEQLRMARKEEIVQRAREEAARILESAEDSADVTRADAEDYMDARLAQFETALRGVLEDAASTVRDLEQTLGRVERGREKLRAPITAAEQHLAPSPEEELFDQEENEGR